MAGRPSSDIRRARLSVSAGFFVFAAVLGNWATRIPAIKADLGLSDGELGTALLGMALGTLAGGRLGGRPTDRYGSKPTSRASAAVLCAALVGPALAGDLPTLFVTLAVLGAAGGILDVAINAQAVEVERRYRRPLLSSMHGLFSVGGLAGAAGGGLAAAAGASPRLHFAIAALVLGAASLAVLGALLPPSGDGRTVREHASTGRVGSTLWTAAVLLLGLVGFSSLVGEGSAADWSAVYLHESLGSTPGFAAAGFAAFSFAMAACRFVADRLVARFGPVSVVRAGSLVAAGGLALGLAVHEPAAAVAGFALLGAGLAPVVPITFSAAGNTGLGPTGAILGRVVTISYVGLVVGPIAIGWVAEQVGLRAALGIPAALALLVAAVAGRVRIAA